MIASVAQRDIWLNGISGDRRIHSGDGREG